MTISCVSCEAGFGVDIPKHVSFHAVFFYEKELKAAICTYALNFLNSITLKEKDDILLILLPASMRIKSKPCELAAQFQREKSGYNTENHGKCLGLGELWLEWNYFLAC